VGLPIHNKPVIGFGQRKFITFSLSFQEAADYWTESEGIDDSPAPAEAILEPHPPPGPASSKLLP
jgi:hypothetical protein